MHTLHHDITFAELYDREGLLKLDKLFLQELQIADAELCALLRAARQQPDALETKTESELLLRVAPHLEDFIAQLFNIEPEARTRAHAHQRLAPLYLCKRQFVQRRVAKLERPAEIDTPNPAIFPFADVERTSNDNDALIEWELKFAQLVMDLLDDEAANSEPLKAAEAYAQYALWHADGVARHAEGVLFHLPSKIDVEQLVDVHTYQTDGVAHVRHAGGIRARQGFSLTDDGGSLAEALDEAHYCIFCANQGRDSCSKGLKEKDGAYKINTQNITLAGCPLEEKISEMNELKSQGFSIGALAVVCVDNPMCAGTGHRICNDCMKSCIYQKQEAVDIPLAETRTLNDVLTLPYGFEIYSLLTRWNPLNIRRPLPKAPTGKRVLVAGLGPAGYTLAHHLMQDGHDVVGIDGLKIEPLSPDISGVDDTGVRVAFQPIIQTNVLYEDLNTRIPQGFGGVAEYGITVRWNKNYLKLIRLLLERRMEFRMFGGVRFGSSLTVENSFQLGFDHIALCLGAGKPTLLNIPNGMAKGVRTASDFLMALQLTGAAREASITNLQIRLPVVVVGGGLTAIDTATEALAYYPVQVEKFLTRYESLQANQSVREIRMRWSQEDALVAEEFIAHAKLFRAEKLLAESEKRAPFYAPIIHQLGGVKVLYRKRLQDAPSYRLNHEEVAKAFEEGIEFLEYITPTEVKVNAFGAAETIRCQQQHGGDLLMIDLPAKTILIAAGTQPNTVLAREDTAHIEVDGMYFKALDMDGNQVKPERVSKPKQVHVLTHRGADGRAVSFFGDLHPSFAGNVVKAMASAKQGHPIISQQLAKHTSASTMSRADFFANIHHLLCARVHEVKRLTPNIVEVVVHAPLAAMRFEPGQFYRLQNFETAVMQTSSIKNKQGMEGLAMTGAWVNKARGLLSVIVLEMGGSSNLCANLNVGEPLVLMGPTGTPTEIATNETVLLVGGGLGNAVLFSIGRAFRAVGSRVLYFAGYKKMMDRYKSEEIEAAADVVVWCSDEAPGFQASRSQDKQFIGNIVEAIAAYGRGELGVNDLKLEDVDRIIAIGSDKMMAAVARARHDVLRTYLKAEHVAVGSINSPMQCMMKEICAQCLQKHIDPKTGAESYVYSCFNQDQCLDAVSFAHLADRLSQNSLQEKITASWLAM